MNRQEILDEAIGMAQGNNAFSEPDYVDGFLAAAAPREELIAELVGALRHARSTVAMVHREFNSDRFTDRYGDGERATARLAIIDAALAKAEARQ